MRYALILTFLAAAACGAPEEADQRAAATHACPPGVTVIDGWTKPARAGQPVSAAYVTICNGGEEDDALVAIANGPTPVAGALEIHLSTMADGVMSMKKAERIVLPAGGQTVFEPGGAHIMLIGVDADIAQGAEPTFRLEFENAEDIQWAFEVREEKDGAHEGHH